MCKFDIRGRISATVVKTLGSITRKLVLIFSLVFTVLIIIIIYITYNRTSSILKNDFILNSKNVLKFYNSSLDNYMDQIDALSLLLRKDERFMNILLTQSYDYDNKTYIQDMLRNLFFSREDIGSLQFYINGETTLYSISHAIPNLRAEESSDYVNQEWYQVASKGKYYRDMEPGSGEPDKGNEFFTFHRVYISISDQKPVASISVTLNFNEAKNLSRDLDIGSEGYFGIVDDKGRVLYVNDPKLPDLVAKYYVREKNRKEQTDGDFMINDDGIEYLVIFNNSIKYKRQLIKFIPLSQINRKAEQTKDLNILIGLLCCTLLIFIVAYVSRVLTSSLRKLTKQIDKVGSGNFDVQVDVKGYDEVAILSRKFNSMVIQINDLINEEYRAKISEKNARVKALEAQLNPHFLYNSLQAIASKAVMSGVKDIGKMIEALANTLRYCINSEYKVTISKEIKHIRNYLEIHKIRFDDRLQVEIIVQEDIGDILIPRLSIQTIVENSIKHALEQANESILIKICAYTDSKRCIIEISDNGRGMTEEQLKNVIDSLNDVNWMDKSNNAIGLENLNSRLKLMFGEDSGLIIHSTLHWGTIVQIILPIEEHGER